MCGELSPEDENKEVSVSSVHQKGNNFILYTSFSAKIEYVK